MYIYILVCGEYVTVIWTKTMCFECWFWTIAFSSQFLTVINRYQSWQPFKQTARTNEIWFLASPNFGWTHLSTLWSFLNTEVSQSFSGTDTWICRVCGRRPHFAQREDVFVAETNMIQSMSAHAIHNFVVDGTGHNLFWYHLVWDVWPPIFTDFMITRNSSDRGSNTITEIPQYIAIQLKGRFHKSWWMINVA